MANSEPLELLYSLGASETTPLSGFMVTTFQRQEPAPRLVLASAVALMVHYFDIREVDAWTEVLTLAGRNPPSWIRIAVIEALYQGRYKVVSVQQILDLWRRRGKILSHFNREFEAIVTVPLPDRIQAQLRALAQDHQEEHRQQRLRQEQGQKAGKTIAPDSSPAPTTVEVLSAIGASSPPDPLPDPPVPEVVPNPATGHPSAPRDSTNQGETETGHPDLVNTDSGNIDHGNVEPGNIKPQSIEPENTEPENTEQTTLSSPQETTETGIVSKISSKVQTHWVPSLRRSSPQIHQFCPTPDRSGFDRKLLALANQP